MNKMLSKCVINLSGNTTMGEVKDIIEYLKKMNIKFEVRFI